MASGFKIADGYIEITADDRTDEGIARIKAKVDDLRGSVQLSADTGDAEGKIAALKAKLDELSATRATPSAEFDDAAARARIDQLEVRLAELGGIRVRPEADTSGLDDIQNRSNNARGGITALVAAGIALGPALVAAAAAGAGAIGAIGVAALGGVTGLGVLTLGFSGVSEAVKALTQQQATNGTSAQQQAAQHLSAADSIINAQNGVKSAIQGVSDAERQAALATQQAAEQVGNAERGVQDAHIAAGIAATHAAEQVSNAERGVSDAFITTQNAAQNAADAVTAAERGVADATLSASQSIQSALNAQVTAENAVENAQMADMRATQALTDARQSAQRQLESLTFQVQDGALAERSAVLSVEQAQNQLNATKANPTATKLQQEQAQLSYDQAVQQLTEIRAKNVQLAQDKAAADQKGVDGSTAVVNAQDSLIQAQNSLAAAQQGVQTAAENAANAQRKGAEQVMVAEEALTKAKAAQAETDRTNTEKIAQAEQSLADARSAQTETLRSNNEKIANSEQALADARRNQANVAITSQESIAKAQDQVASSQRALALASAQSASQQEQSAATVAKAMNNLAPSGRQFAEYLVSLKPKLDELKATAENGLLPGVEDGLKSLMGDFPIFNGLVDNVSRALGGLFKSAGQALTDPFWTGFFTWMKDTAGPTVTTLGHIFGNVFTGMAGILQGFSGTWTDFGSWLEDLSKKFADWGKSIASGTNQKFNDFLAFVHDNGPKIADILGSLATTLGKTADGLMGLGGAELSGVNFFLGLLAKLPPGVDAVVANVIGSILLLNKVGILSPLVKALDDVIVRLGVEGGIRGGLSGIATSGGLYGALGIVAVLAGLQLASTELDKLNAKWQLGPDGQPTTQAQKTLPQSVTNDAVTSLHDTVNPQDRIGKTTWDSFWNPQIDFKNSTVGKAVASIADQWNKDVANIPNSPGGKLVSGIGTQWNSDWANVGNSPAGHIATTVGGWFSGAKDNASQFMGGLATDVGQKASDASSNVGGWFSALPGNVGSWFSTTAGNAGSQMGSLASDVGRKAGNAWDGISGWFGHLGGDAGKWFGDTASSAGTFMGNLGADTKIKAGNAWDGISGWFSHLGGDAGTWFGDAARNAGTWLGNLGSDAKTKSGNAWDGISSWFSHLPGDMTSWFSDAAKNAGTWFGNLKDDVVKKASDLWGSVTSWIGRLRDDLGGIWDRMAQWARDSWQKIQDAASVPARFIVDVVYNRGIMPLWNDIAGVFGLGRLNPVNFAGGGVLPGYAPGQDTVPAMLSPGESVLTPEATRAVGASNILALNKAASGREPGSTARGFAGGGIVDGFISALTDPVGAIKNLFSGALGDSNNTPGNSSFRNALVDIPVHFIDAAVQKAKDFAASIFSGGSGGAGVKQFDPQILQALGMLGQPGGLLGSVERRMNQESGGNPTVVNTWDSNWQRGTPSVGLMQVIGPTFRAYAGPFANTGPFEYGVSVNPLANIYAGLNYAEHAYPSLQYAMDKPGGYDSGGLANAAGYMPKYTNQPERVLSPTQTQSFERLVAVLDRMSSPGSDSGSSLADRPINVNVTQTSGSPAETGRFVSLALRSV